MITNTSYLYSVKEEEPSEDINGPSEELHSSVQGEERDEIIIGGRIEEETQTQPQPRDEYDTSDGVGEGGVIEDEPHENLIFIVQQFARDLGELGAIKAMFKELMNSNVGNNRAEAFSKDLVFQNVLKGVNIPAKQKGKYGQERDVRTVRALMRAQIDLVERNMASIRSKKDSLITSIVHKEGRDPNGNRKMNLNAKCQKEEDRSFKNKQSTLIGSTNRLKDKYNDEGYSSEEEELITDIKWSDEDLKEVEALQYGDSFITIGEIIPPLDEDEKRVLAEDPAFCMETKVTEEDITIATEEGKTKRVWQEMNRWQGDDGEEPPSEEDLQRMKEAEDDQRRIFNLDSKVLDYTKQRSTDTPFSRRTYLPKQKYPKLEAMESVRSSSIARAAKSWMESNLDSNGNQVKSNTSKSTRTAINKIKKRIETGNLIVVPTDKSGKFAAMSLDTYIQMGQVHTSKDRNITETELGIIQKDLNDHCKMILNIFMIGVGHGEHNVQRVKAAFTTLASEPAVLWLMPKDHKVLKPGQPMPSRALVLIKKDPTIQNI